MTPAFPKWENGGGVISSIAKVSLGMGILFFSQPIAYGQNTGCGACQPVSGVTNSVLGDGSNVSDSRFTLSTGEMNVIDDASDFSLLGGSNHSMESSEFSVMWGTENNFTNAPLSMAIGEGIDVTAGSLTYSRGSELQINGGEHIYFNGQGITTEDAQFRYGLGENLSIQGGTQGYLFGEGENNTSPLLLEESRIFAIGFNSEAPQYIARFNSNSGTGPVVEQFQVSIGDNNPPDAVTLLARGGLITQITRGDLGRPDISDGEDVWNAMGEVPTSLQLTPGQLSDYNGFRSQDRDFGFIAGLVERPGTTGIRDGVISISDPTAVTDGGPKQKLSIGLVENITSSSVPPDNVFQEYVTIRAQLDGPASSSSSKVTGGTSGTVNTGFMGINQTGPAGLSLPNLFAGPSGGGPNEELNVNGQIIGTAYYTSSDRRWKRNVEPLETPLAVLEGLRGYRYQFRADVEGKNFDTSTTYGLIAQELAEVYPHAVRYNHDGHMVVNYNSLSALFVEAFHAQQDSLENARQTIQTQQEEMEGMKEQLNQQQQMMARMEARLAALEENQESASQAPENGNIEGQQSQEVRLSEGDEAQARLYPAEPNPFGQKTRIRYFVPQGFGEAQLRVFNAQGIELETVRISEPGMGSVIIEAGRLKPGSYFYDLIVDGRQIDRQQVIKLGN